MLSLQSIYYDHLPISSNVKLIVYDVGGREVATLVDAKQLEGMHEVKFDGSNFSSGFYFYKLSATSGGESFDEMKEMLLFK